MDRDNRQGHDWVAETVDECLAVTPSFYSRRKYAGVAEGEHAPDQKGTGQHLGDLPESQVQG